MKKLLLMLFITILIPALSSCGYNSIQANEEILIASWADIEAAYQRRSDLIPNLVEIVKASAAHEKDTLTAVTKARTQLTKLSSNNKVAKDLKAIQQFEVLQNSISSSLAQLMLVAERYPDLKATQNFRDLQYQLEGTENRINIARIRYNDAVMVYNTSIRKFPNNLTNRYLLKLEPRKPYKAESSAHNPINLKGQFSKTKPL